MVTKKNEQKIKQKLLFSLSNIIRKNSLQISPFYSLCFCYFLYFTVPLLPIAFECKVRRKKRFPLHFKMRRLYY